MANRRVFCYIFDVKSLRLLALALFCAVPARALLETQAGPPATAQASGLIVLDPGHGGDDLGAVAKGKYEKDLALTIARRVKIKLEAMGGAAGLTREGDVYVPLDKRVGDTIERNAAAFVSLHLNQVKSKTLQGIVVYAFGKESFKIPLRRRGLKVAPLPPPPAEAARASAHLARSLVQSLRAQGLRVDPPAKASYYVLKNPSVPSVLIELGYMSNPQEAARLADPAYQERLAEAVAVSLRSYFLTASLTLPGQDRPAQISGK